MNTSFTSPGHLLALQIPSIDVDGNEGLGWADLNNPQKGVALFTFTPVGTAKDDLIELFWNGQVIQSLLANPDRHSIDFSVLPQDIPDDPEVSEAFYRITPVAGGPPGDSPVRQVRVKRSVPGSLDMDNYTPYINDRLGPVQNLPSNIAIPADLPLTIAAWDNMQEGDVLRVFWGSSKFIAENPPLPADQAGKPQTVIVPAALQLAAGKSESLTVYYEIRDRVSNWSGYSPAAFTRVDIFVTPAPTISEAPDGELDPMLVVAGATVVVAYPGMLETDTIRVRWSDQESVTDPVSQPGNPAGSVQFTVAPGAIAPVLGKTLSVTYVVTRGTGEQESDLLSLSVQTLPDFSLPSPEITQALDGKTLNITGRTGYVVLTVEPWPFIARGQRVSLRFEGTRLDGSAYNWDHPLWQNYPIIGTSITRATISLHLLRELRDSTSLRLIMEVSFDDGLTRTLFPIKTLTMDFSGSENWETFPIQIFPVGETLKCSNGMELVIEAGYVSTMDFSNNYPVFDTRTLVVEGDGRITFTFEVPINTLSLSHCGANSDASHIDFYDANGSPIVKEIIQSDFEIVTQQITLSRACTHCALHSIGNNSGILLDNLSWTPWTS